MILQMCFCWQIGAHIGPCLQNDQWPSPSTVVKAPAEALMVLGTPWGSPHTLVLNLAQTYAVLIHWLLLGRSDISIPFPTFSNSIHCSSQDAWPVSLLYVEAKNTMAYYYYTTTMAEKPDGPLGYLLKTAIEWEDLEGQIILPVSEPLLVEYKWLLPCWWCDVWAVDSSTMHCVSLWGEGCQPSSHLSMLGFAF